MSALAKVRYVCRAACHCVPIIPNFFKPMTIPPLFERKVHTQSMEKKGALNLREIRIKDTNRFYYINAEVDSTRIYNVLIFLHGLEREGRISGDTHERFNEIDKRARALNCLPVFPIGQKGIFPNQRDALAWSPDIGDHNLEFIRELAHKIQNTVKTERFFLAGFSNGASLVSEILLQDKDKIFSGYWIQSGGYKRDIASSLSHKKVVIEVGNEDQWHYEVVKTLNAHLIKNGWAIGNTLLYHEFKGAHWLNLDKLEENLDFLFNNKVN